MEDGGEADQGKDAVLIQYLHSWGLREFHDEASYYEWQRSTISPEELRELHRLIEHRHGGDQEADIQFYDFLARPTVLSIFYSQRFDYYLKIGLLVSQRIFPAQRVLDFGCGVGILTSFFAQQFPEIEFVGVDRSVSSIDVARQEAEKRHLGNICFQVSPELDYLVNGTYDLILSTQALFQSEKEPGLPSRSWQTFQRTRDLQQHEHLETRTGLYTRLNPLLSVLSPSGRMLFFEKTWNLGRRILFQRALNARGFFSVCEPVPCSYRSLDEAINDGPLYEVCRLPKGEPEVWNEEPYCEPGETLYRCVGAVAERMGRELFTGHLEPPIRGQHPALGTWTFHFGVWDQVLVWCLCETSHGFQGLVIGGERDKNLLVPLVGKLHDITDTGLEGLLQDFWGYLLGSPEDGLTPGYENHHPSAQAIYEDLPSKIILQESTFQDIGGREMHLEVGTTKGFVYFYWANTFDQRQLVLVDGERASILYDYYQESRAQAQRPPSGASLP